MFSEMQLQTAAEVVKQLSAHQQTIAIAESCTGGLLSGLITTIAGSSAVFTHGWVTYSNQAKIDCLKIDTLLIASHGAVSADVAAAMACGAQRAAKSNVAIGITGIAGPGGGSVEKPVGLVYLGLAFDHHIATERHIFLGDRQDIRLQAISAALQFYQKSVQHIS